MKLTYGIIGVGALGGYFGGRLAEAGYDVHFLLHSEYNYIKSNGLKVDSIKGNFHLQSPNIYQKSSEMPLCDIVLVCLKTTQNHLLKEILPPILKPDTIVILVQNGLGIEAQLAKDFPNLNIAGGLAFIGSSKVSTGYIVHSDFGWIKVGLHQGNAQKMLEQFKSDGGKSKIDIALTDNLARARWEKLVWNVPYNGLSVVMNCICNKLNAQADMRQLVRDIMLEVLEAAAACGSPLTPKAVDKMMAHTDNMQPYSPSMKLDFDNHRRMEIEAIYTNPVKIAAQSGYDMKKVRMLEQQLHFIEFAMFND
jgi:2-dehydropantoate 2-reductase